MRKTLIRMLLVFLVFFMGTSSLLLVDHICEENTGEGGKLVLDVEILRVFH